MDFRDDHDPLYGFHAARRRRVRREKPRTNAASESDFVFAISALCVLSFIFGFLLGAVR